MLEVVVFTNYMFDFQQAELNIYTIYANELFACEVGIGKRVKNTGKDTRKKQIHLLSLDIDTKTDKSGLFGEGHIIAIKVQKM